MPTTLYSQPAAAAIDEDDSSFFFDPAISPTTALFPPELSAPYNESLLNLPLGEFNSFNQGQGQGHQGRLSVSSYSDMMNNGGNSNAQNYSSRLPSLSPSSQAQSIQQLSVSGHSPSLRSSASPSSNFSLSATDDFLLPNSFNSFTSSELDMLFLQDPSDTEYQPGLPNGNDNGQSKPGHGQSFFLPTHRATSSNSNSLTSADFLQNIFNTSSLGNQQRDETFDMLNLVNASPVQNSQDRRASIATTGYSFPSFDNSQQQQYHQQQQQNTIPPQWMTKQRPMDQIKQEAWPTEMVNDFGNELQNQIAQAPFTNVAAQTDPFAMGAGSFDEIGAQFAQRKVATAKSQPAPRQQRPAPVRVSSKKAATDDGDQPVVGKHNKTERKYRQKVQAAQADLRDSIPALRVLYGTSSEEQKRVTDFRAADGTVDGLGEVTRPNASAKATILIAARVYIELLQKRSAMLQRKVDELEQFRSAVAGEEDLRVWQEQFNAKEREIQALADLNAKTESGSSDDDDEEEEEEDDEPKRKRPRAAAAPKPPKAKPGPKGKKNASKKDENPTTAGAGVGSGSLRVFAAFAMSFSFVPSASNIFTNAPVTEVGSSDQVFSGSATAGQVLARLPIITADHTSRLMARTLPSALVPSGHTLVDWTWRILVAILLAVSLGPIMSRFTREKKGKKTQAGSLSGILQDCITLIRRRGVKGQSADGAQWDAIAASIVGGISTESILVKWHTIFHLNAFAQTAYSLALLALLQPDLPILRSPEEIWHEAHSKLDASSPPALVAVLQLPIGEAIRCIESLPPTLAPIAAIAEQVTLVHIYDLYSRFFIRLVDASTASSKSSSLSSLLSSLEACNLGANLRTSAFDKEIRGVVEGVPKGSAAHALGLVLIGLWGIFTGPASGAQAALAVALAAEEVKVENSGLSSISAMLTLLYPGSSKIKAMEETAISVLPPNAGAIDKLALACIDYVQLLTSSAEVNDRPENVNRAQRLEASLKVQKTTARLRLILTQTNFEDHLHHYTEDDEEREEEEEERERDERGPGIENENKKFECAKERLVNVLCQVGRRAAGRATGRDEDSGLEGDLDEL